MEKNDGTGYTLVLQGIDDSRVWESASINEKLKRGDVVYIDKSNGSITSNEGIKRELLKKRNDTQPNNSLERRLFNIVVNALVGSKFCY